MIKDFKTYIGEGTLWGNTIMRSDTSKVRKEDEINEDFIRSFLYNEYWNESCKKVVIRKENGIPVVDIVGDFGFKEDITEIPFQFGRVTGEFSVQCCRNLTSLKGCPEKVGGRFYCSECHNLTSLEGCPENVGGSFYCYNCGLTSLEGGPKKVGGNFDCGNCKNLTSLKGCPENVGGNFYCKGCDKLTSLEGCPKKIHSSFYCGECGKHFTEKEVRKYCNVKGTIAV